MSMQNILVAFNGSERSATALRYGAALARENGGHVTAMLAYSQHDIIDQTNKWIPTRAREILAAASSEFLVEIEAQFNAMRDELGLADRLHFERIAGKVDAVLSDSARSFDLLIVGHDQGDAVDGHVVVHADRIALLSGRPVLIVPKGFDPAKSHTHAVMAWDGGRAAARALSDGLALLEDQGKVTVLTVGDAELPRPIGDVLTHLDRHGVKATHEAIAAMPGIARAIVAYCVEKDPCLLVMGAYEHSKFREDFLGGVTARVLRTVPVPVLLSH